jgi:hypothetical protein
MSGARATLTKTFITSALLGAIVLCGIGAAAGEAATAGTPQTIVVTVHAPSTATFDTAFSVSANSTSGLPVTFSAGGACTTSGTGSPDRFRMTSGTGTCLVRFDQAGNGTYDPAPQVVESVTAQKANQTIIFGPIDSAIFGEADFDIVGVFSTSGLAVAFTASGNCTVTGVNIHLTGAGSCTITASQAGDANYNPAPQALQTFAIAKADQEITFNALQDRAFGDPDFTVRAAADSGLRVSFAARGQCTVRVARVHLTAPGTCKITASQPGNVNFNPAPSISQSFAIARAACFVPRVTGKRLLGAKLALSRNHCRVGRVTYALSRKVAKGRVISQSRKPFLTLRPNTRINLVVSLGRP